MISPLQPPHHLTTPPPRSPSCLLSPTRTDAQFLRTQDVLAHYTHTSTQTHTHAKRTCWFLDCLSCLSVLSVRDGPRAASGDHSALCGISHQIVLKTESARPYKQTTPLQIRNRAEWDTRFLLNPLPRTAKSPVQPAHKRTRLGLVFLFNFSGKWIWPLLLHRAPAAADLTVRPGEGERCGGEKMKDRIWGGSRKVSLLFFYC